jgi:adenylate kinase family enzyme
MGKGLAIPHISQGDLLRESVAAATGAAQVIERILAVVRGHDD